ncbi:MAG TPA: hypothetical protein VFP55_07285 [Solirubrobacteraceae bacterium]|nr:hypothetical protein [Solirubrobacteraceae bacterium]
MPLELPPGSRTLLRVLLAVLAALALLGASGAASAQAAPTPNSALILGSTVAPCSATDNTGSTCTDPQSLEQQQAEAAGFTHVTVVSDSQWNSMTTADFEQYQLIIFGDPGNCSVDTMGPGSVAAMTAPVWEPAVMSTGGNKVLIGTTPTKHYLQNNAPDAPALEEQSLSYAGAVSGATGVYVDLNCAYDTAPQGTAVPFLDGLSTQTGTDMFQVMGYDPNPPPALFDPTTACDTKVNIVASTSLTSGLTDSSLGPWDCSVHEAFTGFPSDYTPLVLAPSSSGFPSQYCANDVDTGAQACGSPYILVSGGGVSVTSDIALSPPSQDAPTSPTTPGSATVTATVTNGGTPESGKTVTFLVTGGPDKGQTASVPTDTNGQAQFTVNNSGVAGSDTVSASFTNDSGNVEKALSTINFQGPNNVSATSQNITGTQGTDLGNPVVATFNDPSSAVTAWTTQINWGDGNTSTGTVTSNGAANQYKLSGDHTYAASGTYTVTTTITDASNSADTTTVTSIAKIAKGQITVSGQPVSPTEGASFSGAVASFTNTDLSTTPSSYTATIDWGDGSTPSPGSIAAVSGSPGSFTVSGAHTYAEAGSYPVTVTVTGGDAPTTSASGSGTATAAEATITVSPGTIAATTGTPFSGQVASFTDADPLTPASDYTASIQWGDGATTTGTITGSGGSFSVNGVHTYTAAGSYPLTVVVQETDGTSATGTGSVGAADTTLTLTGRGTLLLPTQTFSGTLATVRYGTPSSPASAFSAQINWGDGHTGAGEVTGSSGNYSVTASHTFVGNGPFTVQVTVTDPANRTGSASTTILIPSTVSALSIPGRIRAKTLLCVLKRHRNCPGMRILGTFRSGGGAVWSVAISKFGRKPRVLGHITRRVSAGNVSLVFKVTNRKLAMQLLRMVKRHRLNELTVEQVFTNAAGATVHTTLFTRLLK